MALNAKSLARILVGVSVVISTFGCNDKKKSDGGNAVTVCSQKTRENCADATCTYDTTVGRCKVSNCATYNGNRTACDGESSFCRYSTSGDYCENSYNPATGTGGLGMSCSSKPITSRYDCESDPTCRCSTPSTTSTTSCGSCIAYNGSGMGPTIDQCARYGMDQSGCTANGCQYVGMNQCIPPGTMGGSTQCSTANAYSCSSMVGCCVDPTTQMCIVNNGMCGSTPGGMPYGGLNAGGTYPGYLGGYSYPGYGIPQNGSGLSTGALIGLGAFFGGAGAAGQGLGGMLQGAFNGAQGTFNGMLNSGYFNGPQGMGYNPYAQPGYNPYPPQNYYPPQGQYNPIPGQYYPPQGQYYPPQGQYYPTPTIYPGGYVPPQQYNPNGLGGGGLMNGLSNGCIGKPQQLCSGIDPMRPGIACSWNPTYGCQ